MVRIPLSLSTKPSKPNPLLTSTRAQPYIHIITGTGPFQRNNSKLDRRNLRLFDDTCSTPKTELERPIRSLNIWKLWTDFWSVLNCRGVENLCDSVPRFLIMPQQDPVYLDNAHRQSCRPQFLSIHILFRYKLVLEVLCIAILKSRPSQELSPQIERSTNIDFLPFWHIHQGLESIFLACQKFSIRYSKPLSWSRIGQWEKSQKAASYRFVLNPFLNPDFEKTTPLRDPSLTYRVALAQDKEVQLVYT